MPINLANVNISLAQFQDISTGKYNAGEVKLTSETTIDKVNNRVHRTGANKTDFSHQEVLAIKQAFVKALSQGGVGAEEIARVRRELGLGTDQAVDTSLLDRSLKPLSRQQIREILDRNAETINVATGAETIRTSEELYADVSAAKKQSRAASREAANARLAGTRIVTENHRVVLFQALVAGDVDFQSREDREELLKMANAALDHVVEKSGGHPREGFPDKVAWRIDNAKNLSMDTGMDEAAWARKLEDAIVRLHHIGVPNSVCELREEFRAVPRDGRAAWIDAMLEGGEGDVHQKVRTLVVSLLQDAGVADYESLSLVNRLPDASATALLRTLAALPEGATADEARAQLAPLRDLAGELSMNRAYVPATSVKDFNKEIVGAFTSENHKLFGAFKTLAADLLAEARAVFGTDVVPENAKIGSFMNVIDISRAVNALGEGVRATPDALREQLRGIVFEKTAVRAMRMHIDARAAELGEAIQNTAVVSNAINSQMPELKGRLVGCAGADAVAAVLGEVQTRIDAEIRRISTVERYWREFAGMVRDELAAKTGIPAPTLAPPALSSARLDAIATNVKSQLTLRKIPANDEAGIREAYRAEAERFAAERAAILEKADALPLSSAAKVELKEWLLAQDKVDYLDLDASLAEAAKPDFTALVAALRTGAPKDQVYAAMKPLSDFLRSVVPALLHGKVDEIGAPEKTNVQAVLIIATLDRYPGVRQDLAAFYARPEVEADAIDRGQPDHPAAISNPLATFGLPSTAEAKAALAEKIAGGGPSPVMAQALVRAVRAEGLDLSPDEALSVFVKGTPIAATLAQILGDFAGEVTPETLEFLARGAVRSHKNGDIPAMTETLRGNLLRTLEQDRYFSLPEKYLDAAEGTLGELRRKYGAETVPQNAHVTDLVSTSGIVVRLKPVVNAARAAHRIVTPEAFRQAVLAAAEQAIQEKLIRREADAIASELGLAKAPSMIQRKFVVANAAFAAAIRKADGPADVAKAVQGARDELRSFIELDHELRELVATAKELLPGNLASALHLPKEETSNFAYRVEFGNRLQELQEAILDGTYPGSREEGFSAPMAFNQLIDEFVELYRRRFAAIDALEGVSDETKADLREILKQEARPDKPFVDPASARRIAAKLDGTALLAVLGDENATDDARINAIAEFADKMEEAIFEEYHDLIAQRGEGLGPDDFIPIVSNVRAFLMGTTPGLKDALTRLAGTPFADNATVVFMNGEHMAHPIRATVANTFF